jgi:hypothetical protein
MHPTRTALLTLRILQGVFLVSIVLYVLLGEYAGRTEPEGISGIKGGLIAAAILNAGIAVVLRTRMVRPAQELLRANSDDGGALARWRTSQIACMVLCEAIALIGFALRYLGGTLIDAAPFYAVGFLLMLVWTPRLDLPSTTE